MSALARTLGPAAHVATAFVSSTALFLLTAVIPIRGDVVAIVVLGAVYVYVIVLAMRRGGPLLGVPLAIAAALGFDSFMIPPTREFGDDWQNWLVMAMYLAIGLPVGALGARTQRAHGRLAREQSALRRVATLVARESPQAGVFAAIAEELGRLMGVDHVRMWRYEEDGTATAVASSGAFNSHMPVGARESLQGSSLMAVVHRMARSARIDDYDQVGDERALDIGVGWAVATPIVVEDRLWGAMVAASRHARRLPGDTEARRAEFTELMATAIANVHARAERDASRARIVEATDQERRRVVRDLHDGAQQRLVHTVVTLKLATRALAPGDDGVSSLVAEALDHANQANAELRELAHGILPASLTRGGLSAGVDALVSRIDLPVSVAIAADRYPPGIEASAYFVLAEALTNIIKHARANRADVKASARGGVLHLQVRDDGIGGARADGSGLIGVEDRVAALGGSVQIASPPGGGTVVEALLPLPR